MVKESRIPAKYARHKIEFLNAAGYSHIEALLNTTRGEATLKCKVHMKGGMERVSHYIMRGEGSSQ